MSLQTLRLVGSTPYLRMKKSHEYNGMSYGAALSCSEHDILKLLPGHPEPRSLSGVKSDLYGPQGTALNVRWISKLNPTMESEQTTYSQP